LGSILPTFYKQLLLPQIPKVQKDTVDMTVFFVLLGSAFVKALRKMLVILTLGGPLSSSWSVFKFIDAAKLN